MERVWERSEKRQNRKINEGFIVKAKPRLRARGDERVGHGCVILKEKERSRRSQRSSGYSLGTSFYQAARPVAALMIGILLEGSRHL